MNETALEELLQALLLGESLEDLLEKSEIKAVRTFDEGGVLTRNKGLVIAMKDGSQFQLTIVQSKRSRE